MLIIAKVLFRREFCTIKLLLYTDKMNTYKHPYLQSLLYSLCRLCFGALKFLLIWIFIITRTRGFEQSRLLCSNPGLTTTCSGESGKDHQVKDTHERDCNESYNSHIALAIRNTIVNIVHIKYKFLKLIKRLNNYLASECNTGTVENFFMNFTNTDIMSHM